MKNSIKTKETQDINFITPMQLQKEADNWENIFLAIIDLEVGNIHSKVFILLLSLELHLKAYVTYLHVDYCNPNKLKNLGHNFQKLYNTINKVPSNNKDLVKDLKILLTKANLFDDKSDWNTLYKYPLANRQTSTNQQLLCKEHLFSQFFIKLEEEMNLAEWYYKNKNLVRNKLIK